MENTAALPRKRMDRGDLFWLVYLVFFFIDAIERGSLRFWIESIALVLLFIALYVAFLRSQKKQNRLVLLASMALLGFATYPFSAGAISFFIYAAALLPFVVASPAIVLSCIIGECLLMTAEGRLLLHYSPYSWGMGLFFSLMVGGSNIFFAQKQRADRKLRMAQEEIEALAAVAERERIARDLHDVLGHTLSVIVLKAELAGRLLERGDDIQRAASEIADVERTARNALAEVRETIGGYRARGLAAEMKAAREALAAAGVVFELDGPLPQNLRPAEETVLALALREAVTNIVRHAQATTCRLRFAKENSRQTLVIEDNGQHETIREGNGLRGMRERVESIGGRLELQREKGTRLLIELPAAGSAS